MKVYKNRIKMKIKFSLLEIKIWRDIIKKILNKINLYKIRK